jgi:trimeric autotransporter adhesin
MKTATIPSKNSMSRASSRRALLITALVVALGWFTLAPQARSACQQGCLINQNTVFGNDALLNNTGIGSTAIGFAALKATRFGPQNTAIGARALERNETGRENTACGSNALPKNTIGDDNIALGFAAGISLTTGSHNIYIGNAGVAIESGTIRVGDDTSTTTFIAGIRQVAVNGSPVVVGADGQLGVAVSSRKFKDDIKPMEKASEAILSFQPVTFRYKKNIDPDCTAQFGLVAEDVEKVNPDLVARDEQGKPYTVRYEAINAMLLNEFLKEHRKVQEQEATIAQLKSSVEKQEATAVSQQKQIEALTASLQKVSARVGLSWAAPQVVVNER